MTAHRCQCPHCAPAAFPPEVRLPERTGPGHFAVRFGRQDMFLTPYLDGERVERVVEALAGPDGWVVVVAAPPHRCYGCHRDGCQEVRRGAVARRGGGARDARPGRAHAGGRGRGVKLPERIKVGPFEYAVEQVDEVCVNGRDCAGMCDYAQHRIRMRSDLPPDRQREVFFHEALHAIDDAVWNGLTEKQITRLSRGLVAFLLDNGLLSEGE